MNNKTRWIIAVILLAVILLLMNPQWNLLFSDETVSAVKAEMQNDFGFLAGNSGDGLISWGKISAMLVILALMWLVVMVVNMILEHATAGKRRSKTVATLVKSVVKVIAVIITVVWILDVAGINMAGIFASLGIASLIIGFSAQSLIEDTITGIFIILEGQYNIGDVIVVDDFRGTVVNINMRTTTIMDASNNLKIINNSNIRNIQNRSRKTSLVVCDVGTSYSADVRDLEKIIIPALPDIYDRNADLFVSAPVYSGVQELGDSCVVLRISVEVREENYFPARRRLNREIKILFDDNHIEIPFNQLDVHMIG